MITHDIKATNGKDKDEQLESLNRRDLGGQCHPHQTFCECGPSHMRHIGERSCGARRVQCLVTAYLGKKSCKDAIFSSRTSELSTEKKSTEQKNGHRLMRVVSQ